MKDVVRNWLLNAREDIVVIEAIMDNDLAVGAASFHAQQCAEKCFKAVLEAHRLPVPRIHNLNTLLEKVSSIREFECDISIVDKLNTLYIDSRYPGAFGTLPNGRPSLTDVKEFYEFARQLFEDISQMLESET